MLFVSAVQFAFYTTGLSNMMQKELNRSEELTSITGFPGRAFEPQTFQSLRKHYTTELSYHLATKKTIINYYHIIVTIIIIC